MLSKVMMFYQQVADKTGGLWSVCGVSLIF
jgi:hypothetical protein